MSLNIYYQQATGGRISRNLPITDLVIIYHNYKPLIITEMIIHKIKHKFLAIQQFCHF